jgi:hypothetical protein
MGQGALLGDAFTYANGSLGPVKVNARVGQFSMLWGQSLILSANAIAGTMVPITRNSKRSRWAYPKPRCNSN